jgi:hypothetical protein
MRVVTALIATAVLSAPAIAQDVRPGDGVPAGQAAGAQATPAGGTAQAAAPQRGRAGPRVKRKSNFFASPAFFLLAAGGAGGTAAAVASGGADQASPGGGN